MSPWAAVVVAGAAAAALRLVVVVGAGRLPAPRSRLPGLVAPAVTAALLAPWLVGGRAGTGLGPDTIAIALAFPVARRTRSVGWTLVVGLLLVWTVRLLWSVPG